MQLGQLQELDLTHARVILVNAFEDYDDRGSRQDMRDLLARLGITWPVVAGSPELRKIFGNIRKIPAVFVYDGDGREIAAFRRSKRPAPTLDELRAHLSPP